MIYKNLSRATKTFYGVTFQPGEEHDVPGCIDHPKFVQLNSFSSKSTSTSAKRTKSSSSTVDTTKEVSSNNGTDNN